jgi:hypothetical protein
METNQGLRHKTMSGAEGPTKCQDQKSKKMTWQKDEKEGVQSWRQNAHEQLQTRKLQAKGKDHDKSSTLRHTPMMKVTFLVNGHYLKSFSLILVCT